MEKLHIGARWQFRVGAYFLFAFFGVFIFGFVMAPIFAVLVSIFQPPILIIGFFIVLSYILFVLIGAEIYARMSYNRWFYEFNEDGLKLERGIIWKRYSNVPYQRIQNVDLHRGIIARMFGFTSIMIQTAGYSSMPHAEGYIPAVDMQQAEKIREFVMKKIKRANRDSGI